LRIEVVPKHPVNVLACVRVLESMRV